MRTLLRGKITLLFMTCAVLLAIPAIALADTVYNNLDGTIDTAAESITLTEGGTNDTASVLISATNGDGKQGCNLTASTTLKVKAVSSDSSKVTASLVDPTTGAAKDTFTSCGDSIKIKVEALAATGSTPVTISLEQVSNNTGATFTYDNAKFNVTVNSAVTATSVSNITASSSSFGGTTDLSAKVSPAGAPGSVDFFVNGSSTAASGTVTYNSTTGVASLSNYSHGLAASATPYSVKAVFTPSGSSYSSSNATNASALTVGKANTTTTVSCDAGPFTYDGTAQTPCSASVSGPGGLNNQSVPVTYTNNTNAGTATASASYAGTANYNGSSGSEDFTIGKADTTTTVSCDAGPFTYDGTAQTPCSASVSGPGGLDQSVPVTYTNNTNAGTATASASYAGTANYNGSSGSEDFTIGKADTTTTVSCDAGPFTYDGTAQTPCSASVSGPGGLDQSVPVTYTNNTNAGTATASASYAGTANYNGSSGSEDFTIGKRDLIVSATGVNKIYDGNTSATVNLSTNKLTGDDVTANYTSASFANKNVGTDKAVSVNGITLSGADAGNYNLTNTTASTTANITVRTLTVTAAAQNKIYDGNTNATVSLSDNRVSGDVLSISYASATFDNMNAGTGKIVTVSGISVTGTDSGNYTHNASTTTSANIAQRAITVTADAKSKLFGDPDPALTYQVSGGPLVSGDSFSGSLTRQAGEAVGSYDILQGSVTAGPTTRSPTTERS